jgi:enoyl-[acyl-carrier-protein] reductase (NADH)
MATEEIKTQQEEKKTKENEEMLKRMAELKEMIEKNSSLKTAIEAEPKKVLTKTYIEGTPNSLKNLVSSIISSYSYDSKGQQYTDRMLAVTLLVEDITQKK